MGFFSTKKTSLSGQPIDPNILARIHTMQHDLENVRKTPQSEPLNPPKKDANSGPFAAKNIEAPEPPGKTLPLVPESPQPARLIDIPSPSDKKESTVTPLEKAFQAKVATQKDTVSPKEKSETETATPRKKPNFLQQISLNLPVFKKAFDNALTDEKTSASTEKVPTQKEKPIPKNFPEPKEEEIRTGIWPVENHHEEKEKPNEKSDKNEVLSPLRHAKRQSTYAEATLVDNIILEKRWGWKTVLGTALIFALFGGGGYFFWNTRQFSDISLSEIRLPDISISPSAEELRTENKETLPFSTENPNPFPIDVETETVSTLRERLLKNAETMKSAFMGGPVPFSVTDKSNTPIAFFIFASVFNLGLSGDLLNSLNNDFRLFLVFDDGSPRLALSIESKNVDETGKYLAESEKNLPVSLKNLLLIDVETVPSSAKFAPGSFEDTTVKYFNIPDAENLSIDYGFVGNTLVIGTSKNTARAVMKMVQKENERKETR